MGREITQEPRCGMEGSRKEQMGEIARLGRKISKNAKSDAIKEVVEAPESERQFREFFNKMPDAVIILGRKGTLLEANEMAEKLSGYAKGELLGRNIITGLGLLDAKTKALVIKKMAFHFSGGNMQPYEIEFHRKDGRTVPLEINPQVIDYKGKKADLVVLRDITERKKAEEELQKANKDLKSKVEEFEKLNRLAVGRELKMIELKKRIKELEGRLKNKP
jgi:PAS domain S-box-containing protein